MRDDGSSMYVYTTKIYDITQICSRASEAMNETPPNSRLGSPRPSRVSSKPPPSGSLNSYLGNKQRSHYHVGRLKLDLITRYLCTLFIDSWHRAELLAFCLSPQACQYNHPSVLQPVAFQCAADVGEANIFHFQAVLDGVLYYIGLHLVHAYRCIRPHLVIVQILVLSFLQRMWLC